jgi:hypothetical protein
LGKQHSTHNYESSLLYAFLLPQATQSMLHEMVTAKRGQSRGVRPKVCTFQTTSSSQAGFGNATFNNNRSDALKTSQLNRITLLRVLCHLLAHIRCCFATSSLSAAQALAA